MSSSIGSTFRRAHPDLPTPLSPYPEPQPTFTIPSGTAMPEATRAGDTLWRQAGSGTSDEFYQSVTTTTGSIVWQSSATLPTAPAPTSRVPVVPTAEQVVALQASHLWIAADLPDGTVGAWRDRIGGATALAVGSPTKYPAGTSYDDFDATTRTADKDLVWLDGAGQYFAIAGIEPNLAAAAEATFVMEATFWTNGDSNFARLYSCKDGAGGNDDNGVLLHGGAAAPWTDLRARIGDGTSNATLTTATVAFGSPQVVGWAATASDLHIIASDARQSTVARSGNDETPAAGTPTLIGAAQDGANNYLAAAISWIAMFDWALTDAELTAVKTGVPTL